MKFKHLAAGLMVSGSMLLAGCGGGASALITSDEEGNTKFDVVVLAETLAAYPIEVLSDQEQSSLLFMREEEKLAQDVYANLAGVWGAQTNTFANISASEATHTEAVRELIERYQLVDPAEGQPAGGFTDEGLQALYTQLVTTGAAGLTQALQVGVEIEELDIRDIALALVNVDNQDIRLVYDNLLKGSRNHLRSFYKSLLKAGGTYTPKYISQDDFDAIVSSSMEQG